MKNLIFVALLVSVLMVLSVGTAFAAVDDGRYPADKNAERSASYGGAVSGGEAGESSGGLLVISTEAARYDDTTLSLRGIE